MLPSKLRGWRFWKDDNRKQPIHSLWEPLAPFFAEHGLILFKRVPGTQKSQPDLPDPTTIRAPDGYHHWSPSHGPQPTSMFSEGYPLYHMARTTDGKDVIIRLVAIGDDGSNHLPILRTIATPASVAAKSHALPLLQETEKDGMSFAVFPLVHSAGYEYDDRMPWFKRVSEVLDAMDQLLSGFTYIHGQLIAHRDFSYGEVLINHGSCFCTRWDDRELYWAAKRDHPDEPPPLPEFRSTFPVFYFINDFEYSIMFSTNSDPAARLVVGPPGGLTTDEYNKPLGPEVFGTTPYCPFKMDVFQLGWTFSGLFGQINSLGPDFNALVDSMIAVDPSKKANSC